MDILWFFLFWIVLPGVVSGVLLGLHPRWCGKRPAMLFS